MTIYQDNPPAAEAEELAELDAAAQRPGAERDVELELFDAVRGAAEYPVTPTRLDPKDSFRFRCHRGVSCWNACCHGADITLTPLDILRLSRHLGIAPSELLAGYTVPAYMDRTNLPVAKLKMGGTDGKGACPFLGPEGCTVYENRPATCRYYPLGLVSVKMKEAPAKEDFHFIVREPHCQGHAEPFEQTVGEYRVEQGIGDYDHYNRGWIDILMKMASWSSLGGPMGKAPTAQTKQMFFMATTDVESFRRFVFETRFLSIYEVDEEIVERIRTEDELLLALAFDWLKLILFNEGGLRMKPEMVKAAIAKARTDLGGG